MTDFSTPTAVHDVDVAFPARALEIMPDYDDIPEEFKQRSNEWVEFINTWFGRGLDEKFSFEPKEHLAGQGELIFRHLQVIMGSYAPKHEHKIAAAAYLSSLWMNSLLYGKPDSPWQDMVAIGEATVEDWREHFEGSESNSESNEEQA